MHKVGSAQSSKLFTIYCYFDRAKHAVSVVRIKLMRTRPRSYALGAILVFAETASDLGMQFDDEVEECRVIAII